MSDTIYDIEPYEFDCHDLWSLDEEKFEKAFAFARKYPNIAAADFYKHVLLELNPTYYNLNTCLHYIRATDYAVYDALVEELNKIVPLVCPKEGAFVGYKKALATSDDKNTICSRYCLVTLKIPANAKRSSGFGRKCRCSKAEVLSISSIDTEDNKNYAASCYDHKMIYEVGKEICPDSFDENRWNECSNGIHFFMTKEEALEYIL